MIVAGDAMVAGASGAKSKFVCLVDYSEGSDMIIGAPGVDSIKDLKGKKVGVELALVEHMLLLQALKVNGMSQSDVTLVSTSTDKTPQTLASGKVAAIGAWYPISGQALKQVPGSKKLFTSADAKGLIFDVIAVNPDQLRQAQGGLGEDHAPFTISASITSWTRRHAMTPSRSWPRKSARTRPTMRRMFPARIS